MIAKGVLPRPDLIVMADTSRENPTTWDYLNTYVQPFLASEGLQVEIASYDLATVDLHAHNGQLTLPVWTKTGKLSAYCSGEWKRDVCERHTRKSYGANRGTLWLGFALDEQTNESGHKERLATWFRYRYAGGCGSRCGCCWRR